MFFDILTVFELFYSTWSTVITMVEKCNIILRKQALIPYMITQKPLRR